MTLAHASVFSLPGVQGGEAIADLGARVPATSPGQQWDRRSAAQRPWELPPGLARCSLQGGCNHPDEYFFQHKQVPCDSLC